MRSAYTPAIRICTKHDNLASWDWGVLKHYFPQHCIYLRVQQAKYLTLVSFTMTQSAQSTSIKKVAVVGSGCSDERLGGHTNTVQWTAGKYSVGVDTGFIVLNTATYPNFINFLKKMRIETEPTRMDLSVSRDHGAFEWAGKNLASVFCQSKNLFSVHMWRMLFDVVRFNQFALDVLIDADEQDTVTGSEPIGMYLDRHGYSDAFRDGYLTPITAAVWSTSHDKCIDAFPTLTLIRFLWNHHQLSTVATRPDWLTLKQGSKSYIDAVMNDIPSDRVFVNSPVQLVNNNANGRVNVHLRDGGIDTFDHVILATHGDQALSILGSSATKEEKAVLSCFKTSRNEVVLHSDIKLMPRKRSAWSSWNYMTLSSQSKTYIDKVSLTYNMNILQHIPESKLGHVLVTMNPLHPPDPALTQGNFVYSHPLYTTEAIQAQKRLPQIHNKRGISFAGAWTNYGFHEDGFNSGLRAAQGLGAKLPFDFVDSTLSRGTKPKLGVADYLARLLIFFVQVFVIQTLEFLAGSQRGPTRKARKRGKVEKQT
ncbi:FAD/NAD(P)-binding domain-containing protein [Cadophora sp. DSE1049]|nr:FAD/NAD(P)-binding domain-containing protein [Cadophora sp. DSE1049]